MSTTRPKIPRNVLVLAMVALVSGFGQDLITPALPGFLVIIGLSRADVGLMDGLLQGSTNLFRFVSGFLSDRLGNRKGFVFLGYVLSSLSRPLFALTSSFWPVAALRTIDGMGKGMKDAPRDALIADSVAQARTGRAFGFHRLIDTAGSVLGPLVAGALLLTFAATAQTYRLIFALAAIPGVIALALVWFGVREPARSSAVVRAKSTNLPWTFWIFTLATSVALLTKINDSLFLLRAADAGIPSSWIPFVFAGFTLLYALLSYPIGVWSDRIGKWPFVALGWLVLGGVELGFVRLPGLESALVLFAFYGLFYALTEGSGRALIADLVPREARGGAYAAFYTATGVAVIVGGYTLGRVWDTLSPSLAFSISAGGSFLAAFTLLVLALKQRSKTV